MFNLFYRNYRLLILAICFIVVWGFISYQNLPRMEDPPIDQWIGVVRTHFPGASAKRVEALVTEKIEQKLFEIEEIETITSFSNTNNSTIMLIVNPKIANLDPVWSKVRDKISEVSSLMPDGVIGPKYEEMLMAPYTIIAALTWDLNSPPNYGILNRLAKNLKDELGTLKGTNKIDFYGSPDEEIVIDIDPSYITSLGLTPQQIATQIKLSDAKVSAGQLRTKNNTFPIEMATELDSLEQIKEIPINLNNNSGESIPLVNIANVQKSIREPPSEMAIINGVDAVVLGILMDSDQSIEQWNKKIQQSLATYRQTLPQGVSLNLIFEQKDYVEKSISLLSKNLSLGTIWVMASTVFLMGWKAALVVGLSLGLSVLMVFGEMGILAVSLNQISIMGLVIVLGMLIDNGIVMVDEVMIRLKSGLLPAVAVSQSSRYLAIPLFASTLTTILTFIPTLVMPGYIGDFVSPLAISIILALLSSLFLSLTIIPALAGIIHWEKMQLNWWNNGFSSHYITSLYRGILKKILLQPIWGILLALILPLTGFLVLRSIPEQFFPPAERDQLQIELELSSFASIENTYRLVLQAQKMITNNPQVVDVHWFIGKHAPTFYSNLDRLTENSPNYAHGMVKLTSTSGVKAVVNTLQSELDRAFPYAQILVRQLELGPYIAAPIEVRLYGPNIKTLQELGNQIRSQLVQIPNITQTRASMTKSLPQLALQLNEEEVTATGLNNTTIARQLNANLEGYVGGSILEDTEEIPARVRLNKSDRRDLNQIISLNILPTDVPLDVESIPLSAVGEFQLLPEIANINRRNGERVNTISGFITPGILPSTVLKEFKQHLQRIDFKLPHGYSIEFGGEYAERNEYVKNLISVASLVLIIMIATLVLSFNSFKAAAIIALVALCSIGLGLISLWLFGYPLGGMAMIGIIGLIGVAINDSIVVLNALSSDPLAKKGNLQAIQDVIVRSTRHVLTTTITTITGFIPLLINGGEFWPPLVICIAGGVAGTTLLALSLVPCTFLLLNRKND